MAKLKQTKKYYFSVEGETEQWCKFNQPDLEISLKSQSGNKRKEQNRVIIR